MQNIIRVYSSHPIRPSSLILCRLRPNFLHLPTETKRLMSPPPPTLVWSFVSTITRNHRDSEQSLVPHSAWSKSRRLLLLWWCLSSTTGLQDVGVTRSVIALSPFFLSTHVGVLNPRIGENFVHRSTASRVEVEHTANDVSSITWQ